MIIKYFSVVFLSSFLISCASTKTVKKVPEVKEVQIKVLNLSMNLGQVKLLTFDLPQNEKVNELICNNEKLPFVKENNRLKAFVAVSYFFEKKSFECRFGEDLLAVVSIEPKDFPSETLNVDMKRVVYSKKDMKRIQKEQNKLNKIYKNYLKGPIFESPFISPIESTITSYYGTQRVYNNVKKSQHLGTDFRAAIGTPIYAANAGKVVLSENLFFTGNTVIIDHGLGLFTIYGHLSVLKAKLGDYIPKQGLVGKAGMTGRVTGPHLHWGVKVHGEWVDGMSLLEESRVLKNGQEQTVAGQI